MVFRGVQPFGINVPLEPEGSVDTTLPSLSTVPVTAAPELMGSQAHQLTQPILVGELPEVISAIEP